MVGPGQQWCLNIDRGDPVTRNSVKGYGICTGRLVPGQHHLPVCNIAGCQPCWRLGALASPVGRTEIQINDLIERHPGIGNDVRRQHHVVTLALG
ncbi:hypothetical protein D3C86_1339350 [compost metagenome]